MVPFQQCLQSTYCILGPRPVTEDTEMKKPVQSMTLWADRWGCSNHHMYTHIYIICNDSML